MNQSRVNNQVELEKETRIESSARGLWSTVNPGRRWEDAEEWETGIFLRASEEAHSFVSN